MGFVLRVCFLLCYVVLFSSECAAQETKLGGVILFENGQPFDGEIAIAIGSDTLKTLNDSAGFFEFISLPNDSLVPIVSRYVFIEHSKTICTKSSKEKAIKIDTLFLYDRFVLDEVVHRQTPIEVKEDTVQFNISAFRE